MAVHTIRLKLDDEIPEHAVVLQRLLPLSGIAKAEFLRMHLYRSVAELERRSPKARQEVDRLQAGIAQRRERRKTRAARVVSSPPTAGPGEGPDQKKVAGRTPPPLQPLQLK